MQSRPLLEALRNLVRGQNCQVLDDAFKQMLNRVRRPRAKRVVVAEEQVVILRQWAEGAQLPIWGYYDNQC